MNKICVVCCFVSQVNEGERHELSWKSPHNPRNPNLLIQTIIDTDIFFFFR